MTNQRELHVHYYAGTGDKFLLTPQAANYFETLAEMSELDLSVRPWLYLDGVAGRIAIQTRFIASLQLVNVTEKED